MASRVRAGGVGARGGWREPRGGWCGRLGRMLDTSASLLDRLRVPSDADAWRQLVDLYTPLIRGWLRRHNLQPGDGDDVVQDILAVVVRRIPEFRHNRRPGAFRAWLRAITVNCSRDHWKARAARPAAAAEAVLEQLADPDILTSQEWDREHDLFVARRLLEQLRPRFEPNTWEAFRRTALESEPADAVAASLGLTVNAVYVARSRVLAALRREAEGLVG
jgi:RNA polymerase sigma factor (sigma-70 family)